MARSATVLVFFCAVLFGLVLQCQGAERRTDYAEMTLKLRLANGSAANTPGGLEVDRLGNFYVWGRSRGKARYGTNIVDGPPGVPRPGSKIVDYPPGTWRSFIAKYDRHQKLLWFREFPSTNSIRGMAVHGTNAVIVAGHFLGEVEFVSKRLRSRGSEDIYLAMFDGSNRLLWVNQAGGIGWDIAEAVTVDARGNCYVTGQCATGEEGFDGKPVPMRSGGGRTFLAKYDLDGSRSWVRWEGLSSTRSVALDAAGNIFVTGSPFLAKYDPNGSPVWRKELRLTPKSYGYSVAVDAEGNPHVAGQLRQGEEVFTSRPSTAEYTNLFLAKYTANGEQAWVRPFRGGDFDFRTFVSVESKGIDLSGRRPRSTNSTLPKPLPPDQLKAAVSSVSAADPAPQSGPAAGTTTPAPLLEVTRSGDHLVLFWPKALETFVLEESETVVPFPIWSEVKAPTANVGEHQAVSIPITGAARFYRLRKP